MVIIVLPAYNESKYLKTCVDSVLYYLSRLHKEFTIVIAEDGSTDGTEKIAARLSAEDPRILHFHSDRRLGRGKAVRQACKEIIQKFTDANIFIYLDVDLATDMTQFGELENSVFQGFDLVVGSRYLKDSVVARPLLRKIVSKAYNRAMQLLFHTSFSDHQCGFRAFSRRLVNDLFDKCESDGWFWDTEIIVLAEKWDYKVKEIPVVWKEKRGKKTPKKRLIKDVFHHGLSALNLWIKLELGIYSEANR